MKLSFLNEKQVTLLLLVFFSFFSLNSTAQTQCTPVATINEDFSSFSAGIDMFPVNCWGFIKDPSNLLGAMAYIGDDGASTPNNVAAMTGNVNYPGGRYLVSPQLSTLNGNYHLKFDAKLLSSLGTGSTLEVGTLDSQTSAANFIAVGSPLSLTTTYQTFTIVLPATPNHQYFAIKLNPGGNISAIYIDNVVWEAVPATVQSVSVTTQNNVPATITTTAGTLQLQAAITPSTANQNVAWSVQSGNTFASVDNTGLVTAIANGTVVIRATSVADTTKFGDITVTVNTPTTPSCTAVSSFSENFDSPSLTCCNMGVVPTCWSSISTATGANQIISNTTPASGTNNIYQFGYGANLQSIVVMPEVTNINAGTHQFRFKLRANSGPGNLDFGYITDITNASSFVIIQTINVTNSSYNDPIAERILTVPTTVPATARLAVRNPGTSWAGFYWDDANWEPIPQTTCADPGPNPGDTGCVTFTYNGLPVTYTTVRGADNQIWLQQNLGSTQVATSVSDAASYGDYFQWGRWVDGHQAVNSTLTATPPTPNNPSGIANGSTAFYSAAYNSPNNWWSAGTTTDTWSAALPSSATSTDGCDPCKAIGTGWRLPTISEIGTMITSENLSAVGATGAFASNLKIPASGTKDYSGMFSQGTRSYFWSSTPIYTGSAESFYSGLAVTVEGYVGRDTGIPIRCIYQAAVNVNTVTVTTQNNVAATITTANGTLQLEAAITPNTANQAVTWSVQSGSTSATVDNTGLVTGLTNGTAVIRATSVDDTTKFGELTVTVNIAASSDTFDADKVIIYPNPTTGMFFIDTDINVKSIEIYNTSGQRILTTNQKNINLENAANGLYIVNVYAEDGTHASYKIIKK